MQTVTLAAIVFAALFAGGAIGLQLQRILPENYTTGSARDMIGAVSGLLTLLLALVLGLLIWTAFGVHTAQKGAIQSMAFDVMKYDEALNNYGPETTEGHRLLREGLKRAINEIWSTAHDEDFIINNYVHVQNGLRARQDYLNSLQPTSDQQNAAKAAAGQAAISMARTRTQIALNLADPINYPLMTIVVSWALALFCAYGLLSKRHPMAYIALAFGALGVSSAVFVIADLSRPYSGLFTVSPAPIIDALRAVQSASALVGAHR